MSGLTRERTWRNVRRRLANRLMWVGAVLAVLLAVTPLLLVLYYVLRQGLPALDWAFFTQLPKPVGEPGGGVSNAIVGTLVLVALASLFGLPVGILGGIYLAEFGNGRLGTAIRFTADVLISVPAIVIGLLVWGLVVVPLKGFSALAGGAALGIMMVPMVMRTTEELVRMVPLSQREAALALGATRAKTTFTVVMAAAIGGVITGILLAVARVAGEAAPLLFTAGDNRFLSVNITQQTSSLPVTIYLYATTPYRDLNEKAWAGALVLVALILILSIAARYVTRGRFRLVR